MVRLLTALCAVVLLAALPVGCGRGDPVAVPGVHPSAATGSPATPPTTAPTAADPTVAPGVRASALDGLAGYLTAVTAFDARLRSTAVLVNRDVTSRGITVSAHTRAAIAGLDLTPVARALPAGMGPRLTSASLLVFSELASRRYAFHGVPWSGTVVRGSQDYSIMNACLANGARAAARFATDLAALRRLAAASSPFVVAPAASRATAEIALQTRFVTGSNGCCDSCGGYVSGTVQPVVWAAKDYPGGVHVDGTIGGIEFDAAYRGHRGWEVQIHAG